MTNKQKLEKVCKELNLKIKELYYDKHISYDAGGWNLLIENPIDNTLDCFYSWHTVDEIIGDLYADWRI